MPADCGVDCRVVSLKWVGEDAESAVEMKTTCPLAFSAPPNFAARLMPEVRLLFCEERSRVGVVRPFMPLLVKFSLAREETRVWYWMSWRRFSGLRSNRGVWCCALYADMASLLGARNVMG